MNKNKIKIAILAFSSVLLVSLTSSAILADISAHFSHVSQSVIQMVLTIPSLIGMVFAIISGPLSKKISKKTLVLSALVFYLFGGSIAYLFGEISIYILLFSSFLIGVGQGINATMSMALIADYFVGEECSSLMGVQSAFVNAGSMLLLLLSGILAGIRWNYSYLVYLIFIPVIIIVAKNLSNDPSIHPEEDSSIHTGKLNSKVYYMCIIFLCFSTLVAVLPTNISLFISNNGLGNATSSGFANSLMAGVGALTGFGYGQIKKLLKNLIIPTALVVSAIGLSLPFFFGTLSSIFFAAACTGFATSLMFPSIIYIVSSSVAPSMSATAIALANGASSISMFISPIIINSISSQFDTGSARVKFIIASLGLLFVAVVFIIKDYHQKTNFLIKND